MKQRKRSKAGNEKKGGILKQRYRAAEDAVWNEVSK